MKICKPVMNLTTSIKYTKIQKFNMIYEMFLLTKVQTAIIYNCLHTFLL